MLAVGDVQPGDTVQIRITCTANLPSTSVTVKASMLQDEVFWAGYEVLNASTLTLTEFSTTRISGRITCDRDGLLYTSIPQNGNWVAYVDGNKAEISLVGDCMVGLMLSEGTHTVQFRYENQAFRIGAWITAGSALAFAAFALTDHLLRRRKEKA